MKKEGALFDLIKSLTKSEKIFIKTFASRYADKDKNNYIKLFDSIDRLKEYDESKWRKLINNKAFSKNFRGVRNYLYFLILNCLDFYHKDSSIDRRTSKYMNIARVLSEKRLDQQSDKIIEKARKISSEFNRYENIIALNSLKKNTGFKRETITPDIISSYYKESLSAAENIKLKIEYNNLYDELLYIRRHIGLITNPKDKNKLKVFNDNPYFREEPKTNSFDANMYYLLSKVEYSRILMDKKSGNIYIRKLIDLFKNNINRITDNVDYYTYALNVFISERVYGNNRNEAEAALATILSVPSLIDTKIVSNDIRVQIFQIYYPLLTHVALVFRDYESAIPHIQKFEVEKRGIEKYFTPSFLLCLESNIACVYFGLGNYKETLKWCNKTVKHPPHTRDDVMYKVHILNLLNHYELGNQVVLPSIIRSTLRSIKKINRYNPFIIVILKYLNLLFAIESKKEKKLIFIQFKEEMIPFTKNEFENVIFDNIDIIGWIDRKIENPS